LVESSDVGPRIRVDVLGRGGGAAQPAGAADASGGRIAFGSVGLGRSHVRRVRVTNVSGQALVVSGEILYARTGVVNGVSNNNGCRWKIRLGKLSGSAQWRAGGPALLSRGQIARRTAAAAAAVVRAEKALQEGRPQAERPGPTRPAASVGNVDGAGAAVFELRPGATAVVELRFKAPRWLPAARLVPRRLRGADPRGEAEDLGVGRGLPAGALSFDRRRRRSVLDPDADSSFAGMGPASANKCARQRQVAPDPRAAAAAVEGAAPHRAVFLLHAGPPRTTAAPGPADAPMCYALTALVGVSHLQVKPGGVTTVGKGPGADAASVAGRYAQRLGDVGGTGAAPAEAVAAGELPPPGARSADASSAAAPASGSRLAGIGDGPLRFRVRAGEATEASGELRLRNVGDADAEVQAMIVGGRGGFALAQPRLIIPAGGGAVSVRVTWRHREMDEQQARREELLAGNASRPSLDAMARRSEALADARRRATVGGQNVVERATLLLRDGVALYEVELLGVRERGEGRGP
jgi:hypothetical protein